MFNLFLFFVCVCWDIDIIINYVFFIFINKPSLCSYSYKTKVAHWVSIEIWALLTSPPPPPPPPKSVYYFQLVWASFFCPKLADWQVKQFTHGCIMTEWVFFTSFYLTFASLCVADQTNKFQTICHCRCAIKIVVL